MVDLVRDFLGANLPELLRCGCQYRNPEKECKNQSLHLIPI